MRIKYLLFFFFSFLLINSPSYSFPSKIKIELDPNNFGKYQKNIFRAYVENVDQEKHVIKLIVDENDKGKIIGKDGRVAQAIRSLLRVAAVKLNTRINLDIE